LFVQLRFLRIGGAGTAFGALWYFSEGKSFL